MAEYKEDFEVTEGEVLERVEALCRHLTSNGTFTEDSPVKSVDVCRYIDNSYYWLIGELAKNGYAITATNDDVKGALQELQAIDAAVQVEYSMSVTDTGEPNDRYKGLIARRDRLSRNLIQTDALEQLGQTRERSRSEYLNLTGRSIDRKETVYGDSDVVQPRFPRGFGQHSDTRSKSGKHTSAGADPDLQ